MHNKIGVRALGVLDLLVAEQVMYLEGSADAKSALEITSFQCHTQKAPSRFLVTSVRGNESASSAEKKPPLCKDQSLLSYTLANTNRMRQVGLYIVQCALNSALE